MLTCLYTDMKCWLIRRCSEKHQNRERRELSSRHYDAFLFSLSNIPGRIKLEPTKYFIWVSSLPALIKFIDAKAISALGFVIIFAIFWIENGKKNILNDHFSFATTLLSNNLKISCRIEIQLIIDHFFLLFSSQCYVYAHAGG